VPRRNRVTPYGELIAVADRGMFWGNRGALVGGDGSLARYSRGKAWMICVLSYKGIRRQQWTPGRLTELFFLDEATALAAGHRPCGECRYRDYQEFKRRWAAALGDPPRAEARAERTLPTVHEIDARLHTDRLAVPGAHRDRLAGAKVRRTYTAALTDLPDGAMAELAGVPHLVLGGRLLRWTPGGYTSDPPTPSDLVTPSDPVTAIVPPTVNGLVTAIVPPTSSGLVTVITPRSTVAVLAAGYRPVLHESAADLT
jgi:hypothetical protein